MGKLKEYYIEMPLTGMATGTVVAESEEEAINLFAEDCTSDNIEWGVDPSNATAIEGDEVEDDENKDDDLTPTDDGIIVL